MGGSGKPAGVATRRVRSSITSSGANREGEDGDGGDVRDEETHPPPP